MESIASIIPKIYRDTSAFATQNPQYDKTILPCHTEPTGEVSQNRIFYNTESESIFKNFLSYILPVLSNLCESTGAIKGETLNKEKLNNLSIPLPPLAEQKEIVKILDKLFELSKCLRID